MRIVDLDSLAFFENWCQPTKDGRYLRKRPHAELPDLKTALEYLFFQVIVISEAWLGRISEGGAIASDIAVKNVAAKEWLAGGPHQVCDEPYILKTMEDVGVKFGIPKQSDLMLQEGAAQGDVAQSQTDAPS